MKPDEERSQVVKLRWEDIENLPTVYVNHVMVSHASGDEFYLIFGEASPPSEMIRGEVLKHVAIQPRVKIAMSPGSMMRISAAIQTNARNFAEKMQAEQEETDADDSN